MALYRTQGGELVEAVAQSEGERLVPRLHVETAEGVKIKVREFVHPHTKWKDPDRVTLKVPRGETTTKLFAKHLQDLGIHLHPEFPKIKKGGQYLVAVVRKGDWDAKGKSLHVAPKPPDPPRVPDPPKLTKEEIKFIRMLKQHEDNDQWGQWGPGATPYYGKKLDAMEHDIALKLHDKKFVHQIMTIYDTLNKREHRLVTFAGEPYYPHFEPGGHSTQDKIDPKDVKKAKAVYAHVASFVDDFLSAHKKAYGY